MKNLHPRTKLISLLAAACLALVWFALSTTARAVDPPPDGGYPNQNTAEGDDALFSLNTGTDNTAIGFNALFGNTSGTGNTAIGSQALVSNTAGSSNTACGVRALEKNDGGANTATGIDSLSNNTSGIGNTAVGAGSLASNTTGEENIAIGDDALVANITGSENIAIGFKAGLSVTSGSNNIDIGNHGHHGDSQTIRIGTNRTHTNTYVAGISGVSVPEGVGVIIDTKGHLGTIVSSERYKDSIKPMDKASEAILALQPVTFHYKHELDPEGIPQFGLMAEDVEKVNPDLVARDEQGKPYTVRYEAVNAMLLNEFLKEHKKVKELEAKLAKQEKDFTARLQKQDAKIQQVNDKLEWSKSAPRTVLNKR
jgi:trimeric autotransporter adhesin